MWVYNTAATIRQGAKTDTDAKILNVKLSLNRTGPYKVLAVGPLTAVDTPVGSPLGGKLLCFGSTLRPVSYTHLTLPTIYSV